MPEADIQSKPVIFLGVPDYNRIDYLIVDGSNMSEAIRDIWKRFDDLIAKSETAEAKALVEAIKLQTELLNLRIAPLEHHIAMLGHQLGNK